jgi:hypothetical protein
VEKTVKVHITIEISVEDDYDTGYTIAQWNALAETERSRVVGDMWQDEAAGHDGGGITVITEGAEAV